MIQAWTVLLDSLRMLRSSKLFAASLIITILLGLTFASTRFDTESMSIGFGLFKWNSELFQFGNPEEIYISLFHNIFVTWWLAWFAILLAVISTCQIFPQFLQSGSVDIALSKPISRARLFLLKYFCGLSFVILQTFIFCLIVFIAMRFRIDQWNFTIFWAVPVIAFAFSILHSVSVLIGVVTRSVLLALLGTLLFWGATLMMQWGEDVTYQLTQTIPSAGLEMNMKTGQLEERQNEPSAGLKKFADFLHRANVYIPKTRECTKSLIRLITYRDKNGEVIKAYGGDGELVEEAMKQHIERYSWSEVYLSSIIFQVLLLSLAMTIFARRDY